MRFVLMSMIVVGTIAASEAQAQRQPGGPITAPRGGGMIYFLTDDNKALQEELKLTDEQIGKLKDALKPVHERRREMMQGFNPRETTDEKLKEMQEETVKLVGEAKKAAEDILKPEQFKRLKQLNYQMWGVRAFVEKDVQAALKMTDEQKEKVKGIVEESGKVIKELQRKTADGLQPGGDADEMRKSLREMQTKMADLLTEAEAKVTKTLTSDQKKAWADMQGEKFDITKLQPQRPRRDK